MKTEETDLEEKIRAYLDGELSPAEKRALEESIQKDEELRLQVEESRELMRAMEVYFIRREARRILTSRPKKRRLRAYLLPLAVAASLLLIALFTYLSFSKNYFESYPAEFSELRGEQQPAGPSTPFEAFTAGRQAFLSGEFEEATRHFSQALQQQDDPLRPYFVESVKWNLCVSHLMNDEPKEALKLFNELNHLENPRYPVSVLTRWKIRWQITLKLITEGKN